MYDFESSNCFTVDDIGGQGVPNINDPIKKEMLGFV